MASRRNKSNDVYDPFGDDDRPAMNAQDVDRQLFGSMDPTVPIEDLRLDGGTQPRAALNDEVVEEYAEAMQRNDRFPPVVVFHDGENYWLVDGFHRVEASRRLGIEKIRTEIKHGSQRDAVLFSLGVNAQHGLRRTSQDKRRAVTAMLLDDEWGKWSTREIARHCHVSPDTVSRRKQEMIQEGSLSDSDSESTYRTKHGTVTTMNTAGIADAARQRAQAGNPESQPNQPAPALDTPPSSPPARKPVAQRDDDLDQPLSGNDYQIGDPDPGDDWVQDNQRPIREQTGDYSVVYDDLLDLFSGLADQIVQISNVVEDFIQNDDPVSDDAIRVAHDVLDYTNGYESAHGWKLGLLDLIEKLIEGNSGE